MWAGRFIHVGTCCCGWWGCEGPIWSLQESCAFLWLNLLTATYWLVVLTAEQHFVARTCMYTYKISVCACVWRGEHINLKITPKSPNRIIYNQVLVAKSRSGLFQTVVAAVRLCKLCELFGRRRERSDRRWCILVHAVVSECASLLGLFSVL